MVLSKQYMNIFIPIEYCGKYSMDIFLYHLIMADISKTIILPKLPAIFTTNYIIYSIYTLCCMIVAPVIIRLLYNKVSSYCNLEWNKLIQKEEENENYAELS